MKAKTIAFVLLAGLLTLVTTPVYAQGVPSLPHAFHGTVEVNGSPAAVGTEVEARGEGVQVGIGNNPIVTTAEGRYGSSEALEPKLIVQGDIVEGSSVTFYVNGVSTGQTAEWHSGEVTEFNLTATTEGSPPGTTEPPPGTTESTPGLAAFSLSSLTISPGEIALGESVTISVEVANTGEEAGSCEVILKIDDVVEASKEASVAAGASQEVSFTVAKDVAKTYSVDVNGLSGTFVVRGGAPAPPAPPPAPPAPPAPSPAPEAPAEPVNWTVLWGVIGGMAAIGITTFVLARRRAKRKVY